MVDMGVSAGSGTKHSSYLLPLFLFLLLLLLPSVLRADN
jgi:hypothetical protein